MKITFLNTKSGLDDIIFSLFCVLLFSISFNTRKIFISKYTYLSGNYNDYLTYSVFVTDILFVILLILIVFSKYTGISRLFSERTKCVYDKTIIIFFFWSVISSFVNIKYFDISIYQIFRLGESIVLAYIVAHLVNERKRLILSLIVLAISGLIQSIIALNQFITQSSIFGDGFWHKLTGESLIGRGFVGVANFIFGGERIIRSYGTFPHPNILAGYLVITIFITLYLYNIRTEMAQIVKHSSYSFVRVLQIAMTERNLHFFVIIQFLGLFVTFSRSAWLSFFVVVLVNIFVFKNVSRETLYIFIKRKISVANKASVTYSTFLYACLVSFVALSSMYFFSYRMRYEFINHQSFNDRVFLENVSRETIISNPMFGVGIGDYIPNLHDKFENLNYWQYQPDHNMYLLIGSEIGIAGLLLYLAFQFNLFQSLCVRNNKNENELKYLKSLFQSILLAIFILGFFDHYFWTSNQTKLIFWVVIGYILAISNHYKNVSRETLSF